MYSIWSTGQHFFRRQKHLWTIFPSIIFPYSPICCSQLGISLYIKYADGNHEKNVLYIFFIWFSSFLHSTHYCTLLSSSFSLLEPTSHINFPTLFIDLYVLCIYKEFDEYWTMMLWKPCGTRYRWFSKL